MRKKAHIGFIAQPMKPLMLANPTTVFRQNGVSATPRKRRLTLGHALEASAFGTLILAWVAGYAVICPAGSNREAIRVAEVIR